MSNEEMKATVKNTAREVKESATKVWEEHKDVIKGAGLMTLIFGLGYHFGKKNGAMTVENYYISTEEDKK